MKKVKFKVSRKFLYTIFRDLSTHIGWSNFYNKYVIVEPIWYIKLNRDILIDCVCIDSLIYDFKKSFGEATAELIDENASEFIEQALIMEKNYIFSCDNPIFFPYNRVEKFINFLKNNTHRVQEVEGLIHYHIDEQELNEYDIVTLCQFSNEIRNLGKKEQLGLVISQINPVRNFQFSKQAEFISNLFEEIEKGEISLTGKLFSNGKTMDTELMMVSNGIL